MDDLDLLKKDWQKPDAFEQVSEQQIYGMLHKKSSSIVKWILIISIVEILFWTLLGLAFDSDKELARLKNVTLITVFQVLSYANYAVILFFIYLFYKNYIRISTTVSVKQLMKDILKTRKTVQYYVWFNLGMLVFSFVFAFSFIVFFVPEFDAMRDHMMSDRKFLALMVLIFSTVLIVFFVLFWLLYKLLYGILLKRLYSNYEELKKIDL